MFLCSQCLQAINGKLQFACEQSYDIFCFAGKCLQGNGMRLEYLDRLVPEQACVCIPYLRPAVF